MIIPLTLFICLSATFRGIRADSKPDSVTEELGKGLYLRKTNLLADFQESEASVFERLPSSCFVTKKLHYSGSNYDYYASTKAFYSKLAVGASLDASLESSFTLGATLSSVIQKEDSKESKVSGISLIVRSITEKILVKKDCLDDDETSTLTKRFVKALETLPLTIKSPWLANSWKAYNVFLETFGSHVITSVQRGSSLRQTTFAESSKSYSQRDFQVNSCIKLAGPTDVGKVGVKACANVTKKEISSATNMNTIDKIIVRGGTKETRNALVEQRTKELIEKFLNEAGESDAAVEHTFRAVWNILQSRFGPGSENYIRAVNLQYYYLGYLNYGCPYIEGGQIQTDKLKGLIIERFKRGPVQIQKFDYTRDATKQSPEFECTLASEGCHSDDDCHYKVGAWCVCRGQSCVRYKSEKDATGNSKQTAYANTVDWAWQGCKSAVFYCLCGNENFWKRETVWTMPSRDVLQKGPSHSPHRKSKKPDQHRDLNKIKHHIKDGNKKEKHAHKS